MEVELSDVSLGTSHPKYISRQEEILSEQRVTLDEVKSYLDNNDDDEPHIRMVAKTKSETLENIYAEKRMALDRVQAEWSEFDQNVVVLVSKVKQLESTSCTESELQDVRAELDLYKAKVQAVSFIIYVIA